MDKELEKKDTTHVQIRVGNKVEHHIVKARVLSTKEADEELTSEHKEKKGGK